MSNIRAVLFDLDGTLRDTSKLIIEALEYTFSHHGLTIPPRHDLLKHIHHHSEVHRELASEIAFEDFEATYMEKFEETRATIQYFPDVKATLAELHANYVIGIVSAARRERAIPELERFELGKYVDVFVGAEDITAHKPDPEGLLLALDRLGIQPEQAVYIGDMGTDILAAKAAGLQAAIGIPLGFVSKEYLVETGADHVIDSLADLPALLKVIQNS